MELRILPLLFFVVLVLGGCAGSKERLVGSDRDAHGCIGSAGYTWCEAKQKCIRAWEEPCPPDKTITACYDCSGLGKIMVKYYPGNGASIVAQGKKYRLEQALSASGAKYEGENIMIWDKGGKARLVLEGKEYSCVVGNCE